MTKYNKSEIMKKAWQIFKTENDRFRGMSAYAINTIKIMEANRAKAGIKPPKRELKITFSQALKQAWEAAKWDAKQAAKQAIVEADAAMAAEIAEINKQIYHLKMNDSFNVNNYPKIDKLQGRIDEIYAAV